MVARIAAIVAIDDCCDPCDRSQVSIIMIATIASQWFPYKNCKDHNDCNDRNVLWFPYDRKDHRTLFSAIVVIIWKPGFSELWKVKCIRLQFNAEIINSNIKFLFPNS